MKREQAAALLAETQKTLFAWALSRVSHREDAEDLAGEVTAAVLYGAPGIRDENAFFGYLWATARRQYARFLRLRERRPLPLDGETRGGGDPAEAAAAAADLAALRRELALLGRQHRACTEAHYLRGRSVAETARELGISPDMVKYYLFKTRKILREGIDMTREFGARSYTPGTLQVDFNVWGHYSPEYRRMLNRLLTGNILLAAYDCPLSVRELSLEMGIPTAYMEDELALLSEYGLICRIGRNKWQTNLLILTEDYNGAYYALLEREFRSAARATAARVAEALPEIRAVGFRGCGLPDAPLVWSLYALAILQAGDRVTGAAAAYPLRRLTDSAKGVVWGVDKSPQARENERYPDASFASEVGRGPGSFGFIDFPALGSRIASIGYAPLPELGEYEKPGLSLQARIFAAGDDPAAAWFPIYRRWKDGAEDPESEFARVLRILGPATGALDDLMRDIASSAAALLAEHAPAALGDDAAPLVYHTLLQRTVPWLGAVALEDALPHPGPRPAALFGYL